jgi:hypothetical protein
MEIILGTEIMKLENGDELRLGHTWYEIAVLQNILTTERPNTFVEIGVHEGALIHTLINLALFRYIGIEINCQIVRPQSKELFSLPGNYLFCEDCFSYPMLQYVGSLTGKKIVYCDGGLKKKELIWYAKVMKPRDIIMTHDYSDGKRFLYEINGQEEIPVNINAEVLPEDIKFLEDDPSFEKLNYDFNGTRIIGFRML